MKSLLAGIMTTLLVACCGTNQDEFAFDEMTYSPEKTVFKLFAPKEAQCFVVLEGERIPMQTSGDSIWIAIVTGDQKGKSYQFDVDGRLSPGVFAKAVTVNGEKGVVVDLRETDPEGWGSGNSAHIPLRSLNEQEGIVVYELHHRDFSIARTDAQNKGKYLALTEPWAIDHLKELGVNAVHILPSYDFGSIDENKLSEPQYNWGYDPVNYNVPEGSYATTPFDPLARIREFKQMVQALHEAGIAVILDVVYNHTFDLEHSNFQLTFPDYYYRKTGDNYSNGSGCGNETASEKTMMRRFMTESVKYWYNEYHIDGFRFDLMGVHDIATMNAIRSALDAISPDIFIYGEGWSAGDCAYDRTQLAMKSNIRQMPGIAAFSDELRDALRGPFSDDTKGAFLAGIEGEEESIKAGIAGMVSHPQVDYSHVNYADKPWATEPTQMMAYVSCHDDMCLTDRLIASVPDLKKLAPATPDQLPTPLRDQLIRLDLLAQTAVFTSQGVPFMLSGEELLRTKQGVHNSYKSPDSINHLDWANKERYQQVFDYYKRLIALRHHHPAFRLGKAELVKKHLEFLPTQHCVVAFRLKDHAGKDAWDNIIVVLNSNKQACQVAVPEGKYTVVCREGRISEEGLDEFTGSHVTVAPQSALIIHH